MSKKKEPAVSPAALACELVQGAAVHRKLKEQVEGAHESCTAMLEKLSYMVVKHLVDNCGGFGDPKALGVPENLAMSISMTKDYRTLRLSNGWAGVSMRLDFSSPKPCISVSVLNVSGPKDYQQPTAVDREFQPRHIKAALSFFVSEANRVLEDIEKALETYRNGGPDE